MTILIAAKDHSGEGIHLLSDSQTSAANSKYLTDNKWTEFKNFYIGIAGDSITKIAVRDYLNIEFEQKEVNNKKDVIEIYKQIEDVVKTEFGYKPTENPSRNYMDFDIIIVTKTGKIFTCGEFLCADETEKYATSGTGSLHATGILEYLYQRNEITASALHHIMEITYEQSTTCGGPIHYIYLPLEKHE